MYQPQLKIAAKVAQTGIVKNSFEIPKKQD